MTVLGLPAFARIFSIFDFDAAAIATPTRQIIPVASHLMLKLT